jgi:hypothetical protein
MRVAVHFPDGTVSAYRLGRIEDGRHNFFIHTGETIPIDEFVQGLVDQAKKEFPDADVVVERLVATENGESEWISAEEFDTEQYTAVDAGNTQAQGVNAAAPVRGESDHEVTEAQERDQDQ